MERLTQRNDLILFNLLEADGWLTSSQLAQKLGVSDRTVRSSIAELAEFLSEKEITLIAERGKGYMLLDADKPRVREILTFGGISGGESKSDLLMELLRLPGPEDIDELSDRLFMSRSTLENELKQVKKELRESSSDLCLVRRKNTLWIEGNERSKRVLIGYHMDNRFHNPMSYDLIGYSAYFPYDDLVFVTDTINSALRRQDIMVSDAGIVAIAVHILIAVRRIAKGFALDTPYLSDREKADCITELSVAQEIWPLLGKRFSVQPSDYEYEALAYCIYFRRFFRMGKNRRETLEEDVSPKYLAVIRETLQEIRDTYLLDLTHDSDLFVGLAYHLQSTVEKSGYCQSYVNPILDDIRSKYPFVFELAIYFRNKFLQELGVAFNESETAYLAVHLGASMERLKTQNGPQKLKAALVCHASPSTSRFLMAKILSLFGARLYLCGPYSVFDVRTIQEEKPDLIISTSTAAMEWCGKVPVAYINLIPDAKDTRQLTRVIDEASRSTAFGYAFTDFFRPEFFFPMLEAQTSADVIDRMVDALDSAGIAQEGFKEATLQRETFSTTVLQNGIAIPHPSGFYSTRTTIAVATLAHPIAWGGSTAQVVFMLAVKRGDQQFLQAFYELIVNLSDSADYVQKVLQIRDFDALIACFNTHN